jgi:hypothetical protein
MRSLIALVVLSLAFVGCDKKSEMAGRWISKETRVDKGIIRSDKTDIIIHTLTLNVNGEGQLNITKNDRTDQNALGNWSILGDIFFLDYGNGKTAYLRIVRLTKERLVIRTEEGVERIYDRVQ